MTKAKRAHLRNNAQPLRRRGRGHFCGTLMSGNSPHGWFRRLLERTRRLEFSLAIREGTAIHWVASAPSRILRLIVQIHGARRGGGDGLLAGGGCAEQSPGAAAEQGGKKIAATGVHLPTQQQGQRHYRAGGEEIGRASCRERV